MFDETAPGDSSGTPEPTTTTTTVAVPAQQVTGQSAQPAKPEPKDNWQERYAGQQRAYNDKVNELAAVKAREADLAKQIASLSEQNEASAKQIADLTTQLSQKAEEAAMQSTQLQRQKLIMAKFPQLAGLEGEGLLPQGAPEQLEELFTKFSARMSNQMQAAQQQQAQTATPAPPPPSSNPSPDSPEAILKTAISLQMKGDFTGYKQKMTEYQLAKGRSTA